MPTQIIYTSQQAPGLRAADLNDILTIAQTNNARLAITGLLVSAEDLFLQVLEGDASEVAACFEKIQADPRHRDVTVLCQHTIKERMFGAFSMGFHRGARGERLCAAIRALMVYTQQNPSEIRNSRIVYGLISNIQMTTDEDAISLRDDQPDRFSLRVGGLIGR